MTAALITLGPLAVVPTDLLAELEAGASAHADRLAELVRITNYAETLERAINHLGAEHARLIQMAGAHLAEECRQEMQ